MRKQKEIAISSTKIDHWGGENKTGHNDQETHIICLTFEQLITKFLN